MTPNIRNLNSKAKNGIEIDYRYNMRHQSFEIEFTYQISQDCLVIQLTADVFRISESTFSITNLRRLEADTRPLIPPFNLLHMLDSWVHEYGRKETDLSMAIGHSIRQFFAISRPEI